MASCVRCASSRYADAGVAVGNMIAGLARLIYPAPAKELLDYDVVTNVGPGAPFRGPGGPLTCLALEQAVDEAARRLGQDPIALRRRWDPDPSRQRLYRWAQALPAWQDRAALPRSGRFRRGVGIAAANWFYWWRTGCQVALSIEGGRLVVSTAVQDIGTGSRSVLARTVAEAFGIPPSSVDVRLGDSRLPRGPTSGGSSATATIAPAALDAAGPAQVPARRAPGRRRRSPPASAGPAACCPGRRLSPVPTGCGWCPRDPRTTAGWAGARLPRSRERVSSVCSSRG